MYTSLSARWVIMSQMDAGWKSEKYCLYSFRKVHQENNNWKCICLYTPRLHHMYSMSCASTDSCVWFWFPSKQYKLKIRVSICTDMNKTGRFLNKPQWVIYLAPGHFNCWVHISLTGDKQGSTSLHFILFLRNDAEWRGVLRIAKTI